MRRLLSSLAVLAAVAASLAAEPVKAPDEGKKLQVKPPLPPFPDDPSDAPILPPPMKKPAADDAPALKLPPIEEPPAKIVLPKAPAKEPMKEPKPEPAPAPRADDMGRPFEVIAVAPAGGARQAAGRVGVGFFNHSDRDITLEINGRPMRLASRHYVQVKLPREFSWREKDGPAQKSSVPAEADGLEIVFKK